MPNSSTLIAWVSKFLSFTSKWLLYLAILSWPFGLFLKTPALGNFGEVYFLDILVFVLFGVTLLYDREKRIKKDPLFLPLVLFLFAILVSIVLNFERLAVSTVTNNFLYYLRVLCYPSIYFAIRLRKAPDIGKLSLVSFFVFLAIAIGQYLFLPDLRLFKNIGFDDHYYRLAGTLLDPNFTGAIISSVAIYFLATKKYLKLVIALAALALTFSRASYLSFLAGAFLLGFNFKMGKSLVLVVLFLGGAIFLAPKPFGEGVNLLRTYSIASRLETSKQGLELFIQRPVFGFGFGQLTNSRGEIIKIDNSYIYVLASAGLVGMVSFAYLVFSCLRRVKKEFLFALVPLLIHSFFNNTYFYIWVMALFWLIVALGAKESKSV